MSEIRLTRTVKGAGCAAKLPPGELDRALEQTLDFFPPMVDDPYSFGRIAAANTVREDKKEVGETTNMLDIVTSLQVADSVINL